MRKRLLSLVIALVALPAAAAAQDGFPEGWHVRLDNPDEHSMDDVEFVTMGDGYHVTLGPRAIFYHPENIAVGSYRVEASFTQTEELRYPEAYGLFIGGSDLSGDAQRYTYFLVRQTGQYLVKRRTGDETSTIIDWADSPAVDTPGESGSSTNALAISAGDDEVAFIVNGTEVARLGRDQVDADGLVGFRVNHRLDVHIGGFGIEPRGAADADGGE